MRRKPWTVRGRNTGRPGGPAADPELARLLESAVADPADTTRAAAVFERLRDDLMPPSVVRRPVTGVYGRVGRRAVTLGFALAASLGSVALVASNGEPEAPKNEQSNGPVEPGPDNDPAPDLGESGESPAVPPRDDAGDEVAGSGSGSDSDCRAGLAEIGEERAQIQAEYEDSLRALRRERDTAIAGLNREIAEAEEDFADEMRGINADYRAEMRELEQEWREAEEEDRREIEREMEELQAEWDAAIAEVERERRAAMREFAGERDEIIGDYEAEVAEARAERDAALAELAEEEDEARARCA